MSVVTNLILHIGILEDDEEQIKRVNAYFDDGIRPLIGLHDEELLPCGWYGGSKYLECCLYVGAFNHFDLDGFLAHLKSLQWEEPENLQVLVKEQDDESFRILNVFPFHHYRQHAPLNERMLLADACWLIDKIEKQAITDENVLDDIREWKEKYMQVFPDKESLTTVDGSTSPVIEESTRLLEQG